MENLYSLLNIQSERKEMICLVGAGGKTSTMFCLAKELSAIGKKVLVTTTTAIYYPEKCQYDSIIISSKESFELFDNMSDTGIIVLGSALSSEGKLLGVNPSFLNDIFEKGIFDYILIEGDGSKKRSVKAPAEHEPVIPSLTTKIIGLIGLDCDGKEVNTDNVHRPELFCRLVSCCVGDTIDIEMLVRLIVHKQGLFKAVPSQAQKYLILNKAEAEKEKAIAADIAHKLRDNGCSLDGIIISSAKNLYFSNAVKRVSGLILASGLSKRMGINKLLLPVGGIPVIERVIAAASDSSLSEVILVCTDDEVAAIGRSYGATIVNNTAPQLGQSQSVILGTKSSSLTTEGFMFLVGDQPFITSSIINSLIDNFSRQKCSAVVPMYNGHRGNPVIFSHELRDKLSSLSGDAGGRTLLYGLEGKVVIVDFANGTMGIDIDTPEEYEAVLKLEDKNG